MELHLKSLETKLRNGHVRLEVFFMEGEKSWREPLWFEYEQCYAEYLVSDVCDGVLLALLPILTRHGWDLSSSVPATRAILQRMEALISLLNSENPAEFHAVRLNIPVLETFVPKYTHRGILASASCGVDALHTLWAANRSLYFERPTHLVFNNTGSNEAGHDPEMLRRGRIRHAASFCAANGYEFVFADSNYSALFGMHYSLTHLYVNVAVGYFLANRLGQYYISSGLVPSSNTFSGDPAHAEATIIAYLSSPYFSVTHIAGDFCGRYAKVRDLIDCQSFCDALNVCFFKPENCGVCEKCRRTLMALECLGVVERFSKAFDLENYYQRRNQIFKYLVLDHWRHDEFVDEMWQNFASKVSLRVRLAAVVSLIRSKLKLWTRLNSVVVRFRDK